MVKVAALTSGKNVPSTVFRVQQHISTLESLDVDVTEFQPFINKYYPIPGWPRDISEKYIFPVSIVWHGVKLSMRAPGLLGSWRSQITWLERSILPGYLTLEPLLKKPFVFDMDDAIWLVKPFGEGAVRRIVKRATLVIAGNSYLAEWANQYASRVEIIPTAVDTQEFKPPTPNDGLSDRSNSFVVGWLGTASNLNYLQAIESALLRFFEMAPNAQLMVVSSEPPNFKSIAPERVIFVKWQRDTAARLLQQMDVGLMPLPDNEWTRGKCSFKMLQYMASGLPVVVSPVGMNQDVLNFEKVGMAAINDDEWVEALLNLYQHPAMAVELGKNGRSVIENHFSQTVISRKLADVFKSIV